METISSVVSKVKGMIARLTPVQMTMTLVGIVMIGLILYGYSMYAHSTDAKNNTTYNANREHTPPEEDGKVAQLMLFYADWCPHCKKAKPEWEKMKSEYDGKMINGYIIVFVDHNCTEENTETAELSNKYNIEGYPTIKLIKDDQVIEYDAKPTKSTMETFLQSVL